MVVGIKKRPPLFLEKQVRNLGKPFQVQDTDIDQPSTIGFYYTARVHDISDAKPAANTLIRSQRCKEGNTIELQPN